MSDNKKKVSLEQYGGAEQGVKVMRQKIGDVRDLGHAEAELATVIDGAEAAEQQAIMERVIETLRQIYDPEIPLNVYDLGLIYKLTIDATNAVRVEMTLTAPGCPVASEIVAEVKRKVQAIEAVATAEVELVWEPAWTRERLSEAARLELGLV